MTKKPKSEFNPQEWVDLLNELGYYYDEPDYHPAWAHYENIRVGRTKATPEEFEAARKAAEIEGHGPFKKKDS